MKQRTHLMLRCSYCAFLLFLVMAGLIIFLNDESTSVSAPRPWWYCASFLGVVALAGIVGGFVSASIKLGKIEKRCDEQQLKESLCCLWPSTMASCLLGGIFAVILEYVFIGGFLQGSLFPEFKSADKPGAVPDVLTLAVMAKVVIFSFLAGFAERLVPDALDRLVAASREHPAAGHWSEGDGTIAVNGTDPEVTQSLAGR